ncbi:hypothetical protein LTR10_014741 [Elasticomyces elasticus]|uniref:Uncharacterized protein n=1 Tax=Exophiala sideris TaxID=1016849 RepID=A0ABR0J7E0_9EURO|nr:hypothetical protein LTR10_014741 [Elasticomyces elasticus]KAK5029386.1 hypothetical protein LTS07_005848 [Exophiala sideris]KAK5036916.1 hypothetical protein LTR13_005296 [Exophiala sideris]KAK5058016.1 hypothetical protein LTR69_007013 [Exophiala sideris]KAK5181975.1 hypothetical protein LTR44_005576 [Eurotiomycetes sp. CCFEE 6388]
MAMWTTANLLVSSLLDGPLLVAAFPTSHRGLETPGPLFTGDFNHISAQDHGGILNRRLSESTGNAAQVPVRQGVSDHALVFFLVAVGFFSVSLIWHMYIRIGWDRDGARQIDKTATTAMEMDRLPSDGAGQAESKRTPRGAGRWLSAAIKPA